MATSKKIDPAGEEPAGKSGPVVERQEPAEDGFDKEPERPDPGGGRRGPAREAPPKHLPRPTRR